MTKKDYIAIAKVVKEEYERYSPEDPERICVLESLETIAINLAGVFSSDNPRFDRARFLQACGVSD